MADPEQRVASALAEMDAELAAQRVAAQQQSGTAQQQSGTAQQQSGTAQQQSGTAQQQSGTAQQQSGGDAPSLSAAELNELSELRSAAAAADIRRGENEILRALPQLFTENVYKGRDIYGDLDSEFGMQGDDAKKMVAYINSYVGAGAQIARSIADGRVEQKIRGIEALHAMERYGLSKDQALELAGADTADDFSERLATFKKGATDDLPPAVKKRIERLEEIARNAAPQESDLNGVANAGGSGGGGVPHDMREVSRIIREHNNRGVSAPPEIMDAWVKHRKAGGYI